MTPPLERRPADKVSRLVELNPLLRLFPDSNLLGEFYPTAAEDMPAEFRRLLAHNDHMTLAVESYHGCPVEVEVLQSKRDVSVYIREILLRRSTDNAVVQYGIVRLQLTALEPRTQDAILSEKIPLGRVLIEHNVLREVELVELWRITMGPKLARWFSKSEGGTIYGRTAMIHLDEQPALELLEIVTD